jgi:hypothetical protein
MRNRDWEEVDGEIVFTDDSGGRISTIANPSPAEKPTARGGEPRPVAAMTATTAEPVAPVSLTGTRTVKRDPLPWFKLYTNEWQTDHRMYGFSDRQYGWLLWLRIEAWAREGRLPTTDREVLARFARVSGRKTRNFDAEFGAVIDRFFTPTTDGQLEEVGLRQLYIEQATKNKNSLKK